jgi:hypothetical protein
MRKNTLNFVVDLATLLAILAMLCTGLILRYSLPPGSGGRGLALWGLGRHDWGGVHFWIAVSLGLLLVVHLVLHWPWVVGTIRRLTSRTAARTGRPASAFLNVTCVVFLLAIAGAATGFTYYASASVSTSAELAREHAREHAESAAQEHDHGPLEIRGSMTLAEVEQVTGLSLTTLLATLNLPAGTSPDEHLGRVCRAQGLSMTTVRSILAEQAGSPPGG